MSEYDPTNSGAYLAIDDLPYVQHVEWPSIREICDAEGKSVLDYGCGSGKYSRWLSGVGASRVVGVDTSDAQIALAEKQDHPSNVEFRTISPDEPLEVGEFDLVISVWVVIVAETTDQVATFFRNSHANLASGGRYLMFTSLVPDEGEARQRFLDAYAAQGIHFTIEPGTSEPVATTLRIPGVAPDGETPTEFVAPNYFYAAETYERLLKEAGFSGVEIVPATATPADPDWQRFAEETGMVAVVATKG